ncbi:WxL domain-containing protein [Enterococcus faecalis]|uniref:WxL domain-containing protein n=1 Tax=Enterococcus faecalis TaxID=1351 RepID=UPI001E3FE5C7|nr:WxL domain-containing protein [Enterococcus faecalis]MCD4910728.1 WxL domain-containing protein [Enterococcus faecalis]
MKQTKWQRLAAIGLCGSLLVNAFSGVTAVAETVTIESSPTVASSAKEATSASSATPASTESSQETTETSREEVTQEIEKPEVVKEETQTEAKKQEEETATSEVVQPNPVLTPTPVSGVGVRTGNLDSTFPQMVTLIQNKKFTTTSTMTTPNITIGFNIKSDNGETINLSDFTMSAEVIDNVRSYYDAITVNKSISPVKTSLTGFDVTLPSKSLNFNNKWTRYFLENVHFKVPKYIESVDISGSWQGIMSDRISTNTEELLVNKLDSTTYDIGEFTPTFADSGITRANHLGYIQVRWGNVAQPSLGVYVNATIPNKDVDLSVTHKKVTESFKDTAGATISAPTGFTQGKQTSITSNNYTFKQAGTLPETYKASNGKTYKFKGWYKGKTKPNTLTTTKAPSYVVTYDDNDDLNVVYEEIDVLEFPSRIYQFGFVDESGKRVDASTIDLTYDNWYGIGTEPPNNIPSAWATTKIETGIKANTNNNFKEITYPVHYLETNGKDAFQFSAANLRYHLPRFYKSISVQNQQGGFDAAYPYPTILNHPSGTEVTRTSQYFELKNNGGQEFVLNRTTAAAPENVQVPAYLRDISGNNSRQATYYTIQGPIYYYLTNRKVTENFIDASGAKITPPTGFTQGNKVVIDSENFTYTSAKALPATYTVGDKNYKFKGWYKGTDKTALKTTKTPSYAVTYDDKDDMTAVYEEVQATAEMTVSRLLEVVSNEASMIWTVRLKNTSEVPLTNVKLAPTAKWAAGISAPTQLAVRLGNTPNKIIPVTAEQWRTGVNLGVEIPVNGEALVTVNTAKITGEPRQLLTAEMTASGNFSAVTASNFVRIQGEDQTIEPTPAEEGFISMPTFDFGKIMISGSTKQYGLKKAADYYGNGTRNPYLRIKKSQPNWQLTAQLSQLKASADSLPTSTRLLLGNADVATIENYNQVTELTNKVGITEPLALTSDGTSTPVILNNQFTGNDVYQLDFDFANVKLEVPANQGKINEKYQGTVTWNLVTGP